MSSITTPHGVFSYQAADDYTVSESPDVKTYDVVFKDETIGQIDLNYHTSKGCSNRYGWVDVRDSRSGWTFVRFDAEILPQMRTMRDANGAWLNKVHPSFAVTAEFLPDRFHSIKQAFKFCVEKICEHLDTLETVIINGMARQAEVCHCGRLIVSHDHDEIFACFMALHLAGIDDICHDDLVEVKE